MLRNKQKQEARAGGEVSIGVRLEGSLKPEHSSRLEGQPTWGTLWAWGIGLAWHTVVGAHQCWLIGS